MATVGFVYNATTKKYTCDKDPNAVLDYVQEWSAWLTAAGDALDPGAGKCTVTATGEAGSTINVDSVAVVGQTLRAWVSGGVAGETVALRYHIETLGGRKDDRTVYLKIKER